MLSFVNRLSEESHLLADSMLAWQVKGFGKLDKLELGPYRRPILAKPKDVLVQVKATSVNPIDVAMLGGYGVAILDLMRKCDLTSDKYENFPMILGRDFSGEVLTKGTDVRSDINIGDKVYGVVPVHAQGCHSELVIADDGLIAHKPEHLSDEESAGIMYAAMTAWSALKITGDLLITGGDNKRALVIGGSGGVGTIAIQLLKSWGAEVVTTCQPDAIPVVEKLKPNLIVDYTQSSWLKDLQSCGKFDLILDACGNVTPSVFIPLLSQWNNSKFITLRSPLLKNTDSSGIIGGMFQNIGELLTSNVSSGAISKGSTVRWAYFLPVPTAVTEIASLVAKKQISPVVEKVFPFTDLPSAYSRVNEGHLRGKVIISLK